MGVLPSRRSTTNLRVAISQSNYIPWKGYFDLIRNVDVFVFYDVAQFTKNDWRNRNRIRTAQGPLWLTIPVRRGRLGKTIIETEVATPRWALKHWRSLEHNYRKAPHFDRYADRFRELYRELAEEPLLANVNRRLVGAVLTELGVETPLVGAERFLLPAGRNQRLVALLKQLGCSDYLTGPKARDYLDHELFEAAGIDVHWADYTRYPEYPQRHGPFAHDVSVLDLLFNAGPRAPEYLKDLLPPRIPEALELSA